MVTVISPKLWVGQKSRCLFSVPELANIFLWFFGSRLVYMRTVWFLVAFGGHRPFIEEHRLSYMTRTVWISFYELPHYPRTLLSEKQVIFRVSHVHVAFREGLSHKCFFACTLEHNTRDVAFERASPLFMMWWSPVQLVFLTFSFVLSMYTIPMQKFRNSVHRWWASIWNHDSLQRDYP